MKHLFIIFALSLALPTFVFSQSKKKQNKVVNGATAINFYPAIKPFTFYNDYYIKDKDIVLRYITATSGSFTIVEGDSLYIEKIDDLRMPSQTLGISGSIQFVKGDRLFHEVSLTRLLNSKSSFVENYIYTDDLGIKRVVRRGYDEKSFVVGVRYELGIYFGKNKKAKVRFGLSGGIESTYFRFKRTPKTTQEYPIRANLLTVETAVIPMLSVKLSKKITLDFKVIPNLLTADFGNIIKEDPTLPKKAQSTPREFNLPEVNTTLSMVLRYNFKEKKR